MSGTPKKASRELCRVFKMLVATFGTYDSYYDVSLATAYHKLSCPILCEDNEYILLVEQQLQEIRLLIEIHGEYASIKDFSPASPLELLAIYGNLPTTGQKQL